MWVVCPQGLLSPLRLLPPQPHRAAAQLPHAAAHKTLGQHSAAEHITAGGAAQACLACQHHKVQAGLSLCRQKLYSQEFVLSPTFKEIHKMIKS